MIRSAQRILVIRNRFIGDTLLTLPFLHALRSAHTHASIDVLVAPNSGEVLEHAPCVDKLLYHTPRKPKQLTPERWQTWGFWPTVGVLRQQRYTEAYILKRSLSSAGLAALAGIPKRVGFATQGRSWLLTHPHPYPPLGSGTGHEAEAFLSLLPPEHRPATLEPPRLVLSPAELAEAEALFAPYQSCLNVSIGVVASNPAKNWPLEAWAALLPQLSDNLAQAGQAVVFHAIGSPADVTLLLQLKTLLPPTVAEKVIVWADKNLPLCLALAIQGQCAWGVGVDSGLGHGLAALGKPVVTLFGPMSPQRWRPLAEGSQVVALGLPCQPCHLKVSCQHEWACMTTLPVATVLEACVTVHQHSNQASG